LHPSTTPFPYTTLFRSTGITSRTSRYGTIATPGASLNTHRSASRGTTSSFCANFTPSAMSCAQPWKAPAYMGPRRPCMCAMTLCSACPTRSGRTANAAATKASLTTTSRSIGPPVVRHPRRADAAAARRAVPRLARLLGARPRFRDARGEDEVLAERMPLETLGEQQRHQVRVALEDGAEHLRGL